MTTVTNKTVADQLPSGWRLVRFDEIAQNVNDRVDNPAEAGVNYYVGLEHLDPESLRIRRWGKPTDVQATKLRFQPGDIIFGRRRAYQRKLAVAEFEGICSAHALVLRARSDTVVPEFLPFFMQSDLFFDRALEISVGSLSPTINWKTLARQQFPLPPKNEQRRIAEILWAADSHSSTIQEALAHQQVARSIIRDDLFLKASKKDSKRSRIEAPLAAVTTVITKGTTPTTYGRSYVAAGIPFLRVENISDQGQIEMSEAMQIDMETHEFLSRSQLEPSDVVISIAGTIGRVGMIREENVPANVNQAVAIVRPDTSKIVPEYLYQFLQCTVGQSRLRGGIVQLAQANLSLATIRSVLVPAPDMHTQTDIVNCLEHLSDAYDRCTEHQRSSRALALRLREELVSRDMPFTVDV